MSDEVNERVEAIARIFLEEMGPWLAEHDRQVAERAWGEGQKAGLLRADFEYGAIGYQHVKGNPYAKGVEHG